MTAAWCARHHLLLSVYVVSSTCKRHQHQRYTAKRRIVQLVTFDNVTTCSGMYVPSFRPSLIIKGPSSSMLCLKCQMIVQILKVPKLSSRTNFWALASGFINLQCKQDTYPALGCLLQNSCQCIQAINRFVNNCNFTHIFFLFRV